MAAAEELSRAAELVWYAGTVSETALLDSTTGTLVS
jgi:hypothetical protein